MSALFGVLVGIITRFQTQYVGFMKIIFAYIGELAPHCWMSRDTGKRKSYRTCKDTVKCIYTGWI